MVGRVHRGNAVNIKIAVIPAVINPSPVSKIRYQGGSFAPQHFALPPVVR